MNKTFNLLFFVKKSKIKANGTAPIYLRITIDGIPKEISSKRNIIPQKWDSKLQKVSGSSEEVKAINNYLKTLEHEVFEAHHQMMKDKTSTTSGSLKSKLVGTEQRPRMLVPIFQDTGAAEVYLTKNIVLTLIKAKTINENDILEGGYFMDASGNVNKSVRFNMREIKIGNKIIENVSCGVNEKMDGVNLLGLSFLKKLNSIRLNFEKNEMELK